MAQLTQIFSKFEKPDAAQLLRVLVVEDHDFQRRVLARLIQSLDAVEVLQAGDGVQALETVRAQAAHRGEAINVVICDLDMPHMDGMEFLRHLGQTGSGDTAVIIYSALSPAMLNSVREMARAYGVRLLGVVGKPARRGTIEALIKCHQHQLATNLPGPLTGSNPGALPMADIVRGLQAGEIEPFFQPKVGMAGGQIVGAEALARWRHPDRGLLGPAAFIDALESSGNIDSLTFVMIEQSALACRRWRLAGHAFDVSVNLSLVSLGDSTLAERLTALVRATGLDPQYMTLEITESAAMTDVGAALENLARLRMRGFGLSIDDYGTGYSSMRQLARVPFSELKIDREFVTSVDTRREARVLMESSVRMARELGIKTVAEGVETRAEWDIVKAAGCDLVQGYLVSRAVDGEAFLKLAGRSFLP